MIVTIHQPEHLVWLGLISKISKSDIFVVFDNTQFKKNYFENRNKIKNKDGWMWLTVPVKDHSLSAEIKDIEISYNTNWQRKYLNTLQTNYSKSPFFKVYFNKIESIINKKHKLLIDLNLEVLLFLLESFGFNKKIIKSSELHIPQDIKNGSDICLEICKSLKADTYLSGISGKDYLNLDDFEKVGIKVIFHNFNHPVYDQLWGDFIPGMSSLDALFNLGEKAKELI
ncbi:MAG TPA: WbqC family protein [Candidatus Paceibacterota bacterium]|nr:WbqC family protein [Candidatus Paceibacterota bacterium]